MKALPLPVQHIFAKQSDAIEFDHPGLFLSRHTALRKNTVILLSTVVWGLNCTVPVFSEILRLARRKLFASLTDKVLSISSIREEMTFMSEEDRLGIENQCIKPLEFQVEKLQLTLTQLLKVKEALTDGRNIVVEKEILCDHLISAAQAAIPGRVYVAWLAEVRRYATGNPTLF